MRDGFERQSIQEFSELVSTTELLQFHIGCFRCNFCQVVLKERAGKRSFLNHAMLDIFLSDFRTSNLLQMKLQIHFPSLNP